MTIKTLQDAFAYYSDPLRCIEYLCKMRWPDGVVVCPTCGRKDVSWLEKQRKFQCKTRHKKCQFSVRFGTVMEESPIDLGKWLVVQWMIGNCRNGISSYEVARTIGITQKSAWFMLHRLRHGMDDGMGKLSGTVEADETYVGGIPKNQHVKARKQGYQKNKVPVVGMVERGGRVLAAVVPTTHRTVVEPIIEASVEPGTQIVTDNYPIYDKLQSMGFGHEVIDHTKDKFVRGSIHTNTIENFWSCLKRTIKGTYVAVSPRHLNSYVQEQAFRFNVRKGFSEQQRSIVLLNGIQGRRLTYKQLIGRTI